MGKRSGAAFSVQTRGIGRDDADAVALLNNYRKSVSR
jgi:hypothetical protein